jgi:hypothetical protein
LQIDHTVEVRAPARIVWAVVTDLARYPEWNPFVVACASDLAVGTPIDMRVRLVGRFAQRQRETILSHEPGRRLCYGLPTAFLGALSSSRCHHVEPLDAERTRYESRFALRGGLEPVVRALLGRSLRRGFTAMTDALVRRAEELARDAGSAAP